MYACVHACVNADVFRFEFSSSNVAVPSEDYVAEGGGLLGKAGPAFLISLITLMIAVVIVHI